MRDNQKKQQIDALLEEIKRPKREERSKSKYLELLNQVLSVATN